MAFKRCTAWILSITLPLSLSSCTFNPFSTDNHLTGHADGAVIGAAGGAATGALFGLSKPGIVFAGLGGAAIGYYFTTLTFSAGGVTKAGGEVYTQGDFVTIEIPSDRLFDSNTAELLPEAAPILNSALAVLNRYQNSNVLISGNTSGFGTAKWERKISEARAREVAAYLWSNGISTYRSDGMSTRKLIYAGYGNYFPIATTLHNNSLRSNSRIQITAFPAKKDLQLSPQEKLFANIGDNGSLPFSTHKDNSAATAANAFKGDLLPEVPESHSSDALSEQASPETIAQPQPGNFYKEDSDSAAGNNWKDYNNAASEPQTTSGESSRKQGGLIDESTGYKEESDVNFSR